jgi:DNA mismatch repair protein MutL
MQSRGPLLAARALVYLDHVPRIHELSDELINQIAAGEVVERPASALKELVENSLDAGARSVRVHLVGGGRELIEVEDDGCGMDEGDAVLSLRRHATSKIATLADLTGVSTLGFRGEALPSIAAVSLFSLETSAADGPGVRIDVAFGSVTSRRPCSRPRGTTVIVRDLFGRLPARQKFLRSASTELRHAAAVVTALAFTRPEVAFRLSHGKRTLIDLPPAREAGHRLVDVLGPERAGRAIPVERALEHVNISGFLVPSSVSRESVLAVNGRVVRDRVLAGAVNRALRRPGAPFEADVYLDIRVPHDEVDLNVHPTKAEVRFRQPGTVISAVAAALSEAAIALAGPVTVRRVVTVPVITPNQPHRRPPHPSLPFAPLPTGETVAREDAPSYGAVELPSPAPETPFGRYIGQYRRTYLLLEDDSGLLLVDQHVAHERVLVERLLDRPAEAAMQSLLIPEVVELTPNFALLAEESATELASLGLEIEVVSGSTIRVTGVPAALAGASASDLVENLLRELASETATGESLRERAAASLACRAAIKKNHPLSRSEAEHLLRDLAQTRERHRCPHGRPIVLRLPHEEIEHRIGRR